MDPFDLFDRSPGDPFSVSVELGDTTQTVPFLERFVLVGSRKLFNKSLGELTEREIDRIRQYLLSIGWDADLSFFPFSKTVLDYTPLGQAYLRKIKAGTTRINFKPADPSLSTSFTRCV